MRVLSLAGLTLSLVTISGLDVRASKIDRHPSAIVYVPGMAEKLASNRTKLEAYLRKQFGSSNIRVKALAGKDSAEVYVGDEFLGIIFVDDEDYRLTLSILKEDLE
jgi:hypothetical protein